MSKKRKKRNRIGEALEIPSGIMTGFVMEIYSGNEVVLTGKIEVLELSDTVLKLKCNEHRIAFGGSSLNIVYYTSEGIKIDGKISYVEME